MDIFLAGCTDIIVKSHMSNSCDKASKWCPVTGVNMIILSHTTRCIALHCNGHCYQPTGTFSHTSFIMALYLVNKFLVNHCVLVNGSLHCAWWKGPYQETFKWPTNLLYCLIVYCWRATPYHQETFIKATEKTIGMVHEGWKALSVILM